jgi:hypothetical protein
MLSQLRLGQTKEVKTMNKQAKRKPETRHKRTAPFKRRLAEAQSDFQKMQKEIAPFVRVRKVEQLTTAGKWRETSSLISDQCAPAKPTKNRAAR